MCGFAIIIEGYHEKFLQFTEDTEDPGIDNPDLFIHPEKYIDKKVLPYVLKLWRAGIETYESGVILILVIY